MVNGNLQTTHRMCNISLDVKFFLAPGGAKNEGSSSPETRAHLMFMSQDVSQVSRDVAGCRRMSQDVAEMSRRCRRMSRRCRRMSRRCRGDVAKCRQMSPSVTPFHHYVTWVQHRRHVDTSWLRWGVAFEAGWRQSLQGRWGLSDERGTWRGGGGTPEFGRTKWAVSGPWVGWMPSEAAFG